MTSLPTALNSILLVGGHDAGKSNFVGRLWMALRKGDGLLRVPEDPSNIDYVESLARHLWRGEFAPRTDRDGVVREFHAPLVFNTGPRSGEHASLLVPDVAGELWEKAASDRELDADWMDRTEECVGAVLFVRVGSKQNIPSLNWVTSARLMRAKITRLLAASREAIPTQLFLTDMVNLLEGHLGLRSTLARPRLAVVVTAWDILPAERRDAAPTDYLRSEYPMLVGRLADCSRIEAQVFGVSATGGDIVADPEHRAKYLGGDASSEGYVTFQSDEGGVRTIGDLTAPVAWALGTPLAAA